MIPGAIAVVGYMLAIVITVKLRPDFADCAERTTGKEKLRALVNLLPASVLFIGVLGGIYSGFFTPTKAAAFGVKN